MGESTTVRVFRIITVVLGLIILCIGLFSYVTSIWGMNSDRTLAKHNYCDKEKYLYGKPDSPCPGLWMEQYYIIMIIACFLISVILVVVSFFVNMSSNPFKLIDFIYHIAGGILLLFSAITYILSAILVKNIYGTGQTAKDAFGKALGLETTESFRYEEKLAAGALTIIQAVLFGVMAFMVH